MTARQGLASAIGVVLLLLLLVPAPQSLDRQPRLDNGHPAGWLLSSLLLTGRGIPWFSTEQNVLASLRIAMPPILRPWSESEVEQWWAEANAGAWLLLFCDEDNNRSHGASWQQRLPGLCDVDVHDAPTSFGPFTLDGASAVLAHQVGNGRIIVFRSSTWLQNDHLDNSDNASALLSLAAGRSVIYDSRAQRPLADWQVWQDLWDQPSSRLAVIVMMVAITVITVMVGSLLRRRTWPVAAEHPTHDQRSTAVDNLSEALRRQRRRS
jgi:hypothetical protein